MPGAGMSGFGIDRDIRYSIHAELPQLYESRKTQKDESSFFRSCLNSQYQTLRVDGICISFQQWPRKLMLAL